MHKIVLYAVDEGLRGQNVLQSVVIDRICYICMYMLKINLLVINNIAMSLYDITFIHCVAQHAAALLYDSTPQVTANSHHQPSSKGSFKGQNSPGRRRGPTANQSATLPRTANARTIEEEPEVIAKQHSAPSKTEDNRKASSGGGGRSLPGEAIRRSGSWNASQQRVVEGQEMDRCVCVE